MWERYKNLNLLFFYKCLDLPAFISKTSIEQMKTIVFLGLACFSFFSFNALSQSKIQDKKLVHLAKEFFRIEDYAQAKTYYERLAAQHPENEHFNYYLGVCNQAPYQIRQYR